MLTMPVVDGICCGVIIWLTECEIPVCDDGVGETISVFKVNCGVTGDVKETAVVAWLGILCSAPCGSTMLVCLSNILIM